MNLRTVSFSTIDNIGLQPKLLCENLANHTRFAMIDRSENNPPGCLQHNERRSLTILGRKITDPQTRANTAINNTAPAAQSFAPRIKGCRSTETRSANNSIAVFISSEPNTKAMDKVIHNHSIGGTFRTIASTTAKKV